MKILSKLSKQEKVYSVVVSLVTGGNGAMLVNALKVRGSLILPIVSIAVSAFMIQLIKRDFEKQELEHALNLK
ncbi:MAG: hypothetical protein QF632_01760 [Candidatus Woesearchaeota archaeon]|jgi:hypothetical protein|nr:hypothetical protein [Candidatus Woesearchaeota archaeon]MDP7458525.1 hypothetical protein [Candidatus Woesearchaeota archaeon]